MAAGGALLAGREVPATKAEMTRLVDAAALFAELAVVVRRQRYGSK